MAAQCSCATPFAASLSIVAQEHRVISGPHSPCQFCAALTYKQRALAPPSSSYDLTYARCRPCMVFLSYSACIVFEYCDSSAVISESGDSLATH